MTAFFQTWGMTYEWAWFTATIAGILLIALGFKLKGLASRLAPGGTPLGAHR